MPSPKSKTSEPTKKRKEPDLCESRIEIQFVPLPEEKYEAYKAAVRWLWQLMREEQCLAVSSQLLEEPSQVNNGTQ